MNFPVRTALVVSLLLSSGCAKANAKWKFWSQQRKGANAFNHEMSAEWFAAAAKLRLEFIRMVPDKWTANDRDFLIGNADNFVSISEVDFRKLESVLDMADRHGLKIVLSMLSLPGARWKQLNKNKFDYRLWKDERFQTQALSFWKQLAQRLKDHPAIVAYNPLNEPHPARADGFEGDNVQAFSAWLDEHADTSADLNRFNRRVVKAIREVDPATPVMLDCWFHAGPKGFRHLTPVQDEAVLYSFHFYEPWNFTTKRINKGRFAYPDRMPTGWTGPTIPWTAANLRERVEPVIEWMKRHRVPSSRVVVGEFGCHRQTEGGIQYLADTIKLFNDEGWHWAFYAFREDRWTGMDYELGPGGLGWDYWKARDRGEWPNPPWRDNPLFDVIKREFN